MEFAKPERAARPRQKLSPEANRGPRPRGPTQTGIREKEVEHTRGLSYAVPPHLLRKTSTCIVLITSCVAVPVY